MLVKLNKLVMIPFIFLALVPAAASLAPPKDAILVPGVFSNADATWTAMKNRLADEGINAWVIDFETDPLTHSNEATIPIQAQALSALIKKTLIATGRPNVSLVSHSMGGLAARYYLQHSDLWPSPKSAQVSRLIMLGTPNWGTDAVLQNPVMGILASRVSGRNQESNTDKVDHWSPAVNEMFAEWQPAPARKSDGILAYPTGYRLECWSEAKSNSKGEVSYKSPMSIGKFRSHALWGITKFLVDTHLVVSHSDDRSAITTAISRFSNPSLRDDAHADYYSEMAKSIGILYPKGAALSDWGISARYVSSFLADLNAPGSDRSGTRIYLAAGAKSDIWLEQMRTHLDSPYTSLSSDGLVPVDSVLGIDPMTGLCVFPTVKGQRVFNVNHADLTIYGPVIDTVVAWLKEK